MYSTDSPIWIKLYKLWIGQLGVNLSAAILEIPCTPEGIPTYLNNPITFNPPPSIISKAEMAETEEAPPVISSAWANFGETCQESRKAEVFSTCRSRKLHRSLHHRSLHRLSMAQLHRRTCQTSLVFSFFFFPMKAGHSGTGVNQSIE